MELCDRVSSVFHHLFNEDFYLPLYSSNQEHWVVEMVSLYSNGRTGCYYLGVRDHLICSMPAYTRMVGSKCR